MHSLLKGNRSYKIFLWFITVLNILMYLLCPLRSEPSINFFYCCLTSFIIGTWCYLKIKRKNNYLDFDILFIIIYAFTCYTTTFFISNDLLYKALFFGYMFDVSYVNVGNSLVTVGILSYYCGGCSKVNIPKCNAYEMPSIVHTKVLSFLLLFLTILFIVMGGMAYSQSAYLDDAGGFSPLVPYILLLITFISTVIIVSEFYNKKKNNGYKISKLSMVSIGIVVLILLLGGSRSSASYIALPIIGIYCMMFRPLNMKQVLAFVVLSIVAMWIIGQMRTGDSVSSVANPILYLVDLTVPSRNNYAVYEYVQENGFTYGTSFVGLFTVIPFLSNLLGLVNGSGELLTHSFFDSNPGYDMIGLGTTVIADIYIAFGFVGVIFFMFLLGKVVKKYSEGAICGNYYSLVIYAALFSVSVFTVRGYIITGLRPAIWCFIIAYLNLHLKISKG